MATAQGMDGDEPMQYASNQLASIGSGKGPWLIDGTGSLCPSARVFPHSAEHLLKNLLRVHP
ncbi:MAG: hypothetical protein ACKVHO_12285, partial [Verrucomicrobiia bacterium]